MEADITPASETNGAVEISPEQRENAQQYQENNGPREVEPQEPVKSVDSVEEGVAGAVGEIIEYLEGSAENTQDQQQEAEMGEAEYLDDEMPEEGHAEGLQRREKDKVEPGNQEADKEEDKTTDEGGEANENAGGDKEVSTDKGEEAGAEEADEAAEKDGETLEGASKEAAKEATKGDEAGEKATEEDDEDTEADTATKDGEPPLDEDFETEEEGEGEGEIITGDEPGELPEGGAAEAPIRERKKEEQVDENQCRVCTSKEDLVSLFKKQIDATPADMLLVICPSVSILPKDFMPQFICSKCLGSLTIAIQLRKTLETTEQNLRKRLSRSKNKVRRPRGYVVIDAPVSDSSEDDEELNDDEFKVSDVGGSTSPDSDSGDSDESEKKKKHVGRGRPRKKPLKRQSDSDAEPSSVPKKKCPNTPAASVGPFECNMCDLTFSRKQSYVLHHKTHERTTEYCCQICGKKFKVQWAYKTHLERHEQERAQFRCELCSQVFRLRAELKRHMAVKHDEHGFIYECKRCQRTFLTQQRLQRHQSVGCQRPSEEQRSSHREVPVQREARREVHAHAHGHAHGNMGKRRHGEGNPGQGRDLFKSVAPLTTTYWSDSFSD
ncbi:hypothetical protein KR009_008128 [Drosophila setifemur]|nr:hypothetical protein KR009_008128 [Drosophila setifemur]